jgi:hypothetical protein
MLPDYFSALNNEYSRAAAHATSDPTKIAANGSMLRPHELAVYVRVLLY